MRHRHQRYAIADIFESFLGKVLLLCGTAITLLAGACDACTTEDSGPDEYEQPCNFGCLPWEECIDNVCVAPDLRDTTPDEPTDEPTLNVDDSPIDAVEETTGENGVDG